MANAPPERGCRSCFGRSDFQLGADRIVLDVFELDLREVQRDLFCQAALAFDAIDLEIARAALRAVKPEGRMLAIGFGGPVKQLSEKVEELRDVLLRNVTEFRASQNPKE